MRITVYGRPITQGSKTKTRWGMRDANGATLAPWRDNVRAAALDVLRLGPEDDQGMAHRQCWPFGTDPVSVQATFTFARPASHFGTGRNVAFVKASAPRFPSSHAIGDLDKLVRACFDAMTDAGVFKDDAQVVALHARKVWVGDPTGLDRPGAVIDVNSADIRSESRAREVRTMWGPQDEPLWGVRTAAGVIPMPEDRARARVASVIHGGELVVIEPGGSAWKVPS